MTDKELNEITERYSQIRFIDEFNKEKHKLAQKIDALLETTLSQIDNHELLGRKIKRLESVIDANMDKLDKMKDLMDKLFNDDMKRFLNT